MYARCERRGLGAPGLRVILKPGLAVQPFHGCRVRPHAATIERRLRIVFVFDPFSGELTSKMSAMTILGVPNEHERNLNDFVRTFVRRFDADNTR